MALITCMVSGSSPRRRGKQAGRAARVRAGRLISPRRRGKRGGRVPRRCPCGLIPAWAGKTRRRVRSRRARWAHPRVGGENVVRPGATILEPGSSPRGRGKPSWTTRSTSRPGLIPAWAGKTSPHATAGCPRRAHPRVGGENSTGPGIGWQSKGSSPRGRGKLDQWRAAAGFGGLIPAWAGKTASRSRKPDACLAHPRVGGENHGSSDTRVRRPGSSPRGRGKLTWPSSPALVTGLIPAWAGKTQIGDFGAVGARAHPRVGGENRDWR